MTDQPYNADFELAWAEYPRRPANSKRAAWIQWQKRIKEGVHPTLMLQGTVAYARYCKEQGITGTNLVKMAQTFYGPGYHFDAEYDQATDQELPVGRKQTDRGGEDGGDLLSFYRNQEFI